ncbi:MAG: hypothetical protein H6702_05065 [Myxococcales bacterium]|nr:hypothetical protein [Myxococcales bacterium]
MPTPPADFLRAVQQAFLDARGRGLMLSARDTELALRWHAADYPLHVVIEAIQACLAEAPPKVRGLAYVAPAVDEAVGAWRHRRVGAREGGDDEAPADSALDPQAVRAAFDELLERVAEAGQAQADDGHKALLRGAWRVVRDTRDRCLAQLGLDPVEALAQAAHQIEVHCLEGLPVQVRAVIEARVDLALADERRVAPAEAFAQTRRAQVWRAVRRRIGLPALVLTLEGGSP